MSVTEKNSLRVHFGAPLGRAAILSALMTSTALVSLAPRAVHAAPLVIDGVRQTIIGDGRGTLQSGQTFDTVDLGGVKGGAGSELTVDGNGSFTSNGVIIVGSIGDTSAALTIQGGSDVGGGDDLFIGMADGSSAVVTVSGSGSSLHVKSTIFFGEYSEGAAGISASMVVNDGAHVSASYVALGAFANDAGNSSIITVSGAGSKLVADHIVVGGTSSGRLQIYGSLVSAENMTVGEKDGSSGTVVVSGGDARMEISKSFIVGYDGSGIMEVSNGARVSGDDSLSIGYDAGSNGLVTVSGKGTTLTVANGIVVGQSGDGTLNIASGGAVRAGGSLLVGSSGGPGSTVSVSGDESVLSVAGSIALGGSGDGPSSGTLTISAGADVDADSVEVDGTQGQVSQLTVSGSGSVLDVYRGITVGSLGAGHMDITDSATVSAYTLHLGDGADSSGLVTVSGEDTTLTVADGIAVGLSGDGTLNISAGAVVTSGFLIVGGLKESTSLVTVSGANSALIADYLGVGVAGNGILTVGDGGVVEAGTPIIIAAFEESSGTINIGAAADAAASAAGRLQSTDGGAVDILFGGGVDGNASGQGDGTILFNHTEADYEFDGNVSGQGVLRQMAGTTRLTGDFTGFTGSAELSGGKLVVDTAFNQAIGVASGATLTGTGSVGDVVFDAGSFYEADLNASQFLASNGVITIDPDAILNLVANGIDAVPTTGTLTILSAADGITGIFGSVVEDLAFLDSVIIANDGDSIELILRRNDVGIVDIAQTPNQRAAASGLDGLANDNALIPAVFSLSADQARAALDILSGDMHASVQGVLLNDSSFTRNIVTSRMVTTTEAERPLDGPTVWGQGYGAWGELESDGNAAAISRATGGLLFGADTDLANGWNAGLLAGYANTDTAVNARSAQASVDSFTLGGYASNRIGNAQVKLGAAYSLHNISTTRDIDFGGLTGQLAADYLAGTGQVFGELGYTIDMPNGHIEPFVGVAVIRQDSASFTEDGGPAVLAVDAAGQLLGVTTLGARGSYTLVTTEDMTMALSGGVGWRHAIGDLAPQFQASYASGSRDFIVAGAPVDLDSVVVDVGLNATFGDGARAGLNYRGEIGPSVQNHGIFLSFVKSF